MKRALMLLFKDIHYDARVMREATALAEQGWSVCIACLDILTEPLPNLHENIELIRISITTKRLKRNVDSVAGQQSAASRFTYRLIRNPFVKLAKDLFAQREFCEKVIREMTGRTVHVVHCHDLNTLNVGVAIKRRLNIPHLIYDSHELYNEMNGKKWFERQMGYVVEKKYVAHADFVITVNEYLKDALKRRYQLSNIVILRNCQPFFHVEEVEHRYFHRRYHLAESDRVVLYQGGLTSSRGLEELVAAVKYLPDYIHVVFLGYGDLKPKLQSLVRDLQLEAQIHFHDAVPPAQLLHYTSSADAGVVLYKNTCQNNYLSTPNKIYEYMQAEIPVVSSDHPGKSIVVRKAGTGVLVDPESPRDIADGILSVLKDRDRYVANCKKYKHVYSWEKEQSALIELYSQLG